MRRRAARRESRHRGHGVAPHAGREPEASGAGFETEAGLSRGDSGYAPMPGIISAEIKSLNRKAKEFSSFKKIGVNSRFFKAFDRSIWEVFKPFKLFSFIDNFQGYKKGFCYKNN